MNKTIKTCTPREYYDKVIEGRKSNTHEWLLSNGWKVKALPDNVNGESITIYIKGEETLIHYEPAEPSQIVSYDESVKKLVFEITKEKRK